MSREWEEFAWANGPTKTNDFFVYLCLAEHANLAGLSFPSWDRIAMRCRMSRSTLARSIASLQGDGWLTAEGGTGRGNIRTYQLIKRVSTGDPLRGERVSDGDPLEPQRVSDGDPLEQQRVSKEGLKGVKIASLYRLTKREPKDLKTSTYGANAKAKKQDSPKVRPQPEPSPPLQMPPPEPLGNPEIRNLVDLVFCASPWAVLRNLAMANVTPKQRVAVLTAAKLEVQELGITLPDALRGLLAVVTGQVAAMPRDELRFLGGETKYFSDKNFRVDAAHIGGNGNGKNKPERTHATKGDKSLAALVEYARRQVGRSEGNR